MPGALRRYECQVRAVRREAWLEVHRTRLRQRLLTGRCDLVTPQLHRVPVIAHEDHPASISRPVRLQVVSGSVRQLSRFITADRLSPQRTRHAVDDARTIGGKRCGCWPRGRLRNGIFAPVVAVRQVDLLQNWFARAVAMIGSRMTSSAMPESLSRQELTSRTKVRILKRRGLGY